MFVSFLIDLPAFGQLSDLTNVHRSVTRPSKHGEKEAFNKCLASYLWGNLHGVLDGNMVKLSSHPSHPSFG